MTKLKTPPEPLRYSLGIDAGCASVGWCVVELDEEDRPIVVHSAGIRRFEAGVEGDISRGRDESKSQQRREARGPRRNTWRRQWRMRKVFRILQQAELLPSSDDDGHDARHQLFLALDKKLIRELKLITDHTSAHVVPYTLRARALDEAQPAHALGRTLYHLAQRRGFLSNLKAGRGENEDDRGKVKTGISELAAAIDQAETRTLGEYFAGLDPEEIRIRQRWTARQMYRDEFEAIWLAQAAHHAQLTDELREQLEAAIFDQRPLKSQRGLVGHCELEPYKRRAPTACLPYQQFRVLQRVNDMKVLCPDGELRPLKSEERTKLLAKLTAEGDISWAATKKLLGMKKSKTYGRHYEFNFEEDGDKKLLGNRTGSKFAKTLGEDWLALEEAEQTTLVDSILSFEDEEPLIAHLQHRWKLTEQQAVAVASLSLEAGYGNLSRRAIHKLRPLMEEGVAFSTARKDVYPESFEAQEAVDRLPPFTEIAPTVRNPTLTRVMGELRKVVNALIAKHGKPAIIRIELARDLKRSRKDRQRMTEQRDQNTKSREKSLSKILEDRGEKFGTPHNILKLRLAEECNWTCPFTGKAFGMNDLISAEPQLDVEHIIPYSRSLDNSYTNKTLCFNDENRHVKKNGTPFEVYSSTDRWDEMIERVRHFQGKTAKRKLQLFQTEILPDGDDFANRQLSDTRYLSRSAADYLATLYGGRTDKKGKLRIQASPGRLTAMLRRAWDLNQLVGDPDDPHQKDRADHRHHAIDAFVVAVSDPATVKAANDAAARAESYFSRDLLTDMQPPWKGFSWKELGEVLEGIIVSSRVNRKLNGKLHQDTILGKPQEIADPKKPGKTKTVHHVRKPLAKMSRGEAEAIVDKAIRKAVLEKLEKIGGEPKKAFADPNNHPYLTAKDGRLIPIHSARIRKADSTIEVGKGSRMRRVCPGDNHHMEIVAVLDKEGQHKKWEGKIVSQFEAVRRHRAGEPIIQQNLGQGREFVFSLTNGEHVVVPEEDGGEKLLRVTVISGQTLEFVEHSDARPITIRKKIKGARITIAVNSLRKASGRKVSITPLGRIHSAND